MGTAADRLLGLLNADNSYDTPLDELRSTQIEAANERFQSRVKTIKLLANRADAAHIDRITGYADLVPLLFAHTAYKSYPEAWFVEGRWDRLAKWLDTVSTYRVAGVDGQGVHGIDAWILRLADKGHFISCSSGTTGKISMISASAEDRALVKRITRRAFEWSTGLPPQNDRYVFTLNPRSNNFRNTDTTTGLMEAYGSPEGDRRFAAMVTIGEVSQMVQLRRKIVEGGALPDEIASLEALSAAREKLLEDAVAKAAEGLVETRGRKVLVIGQFPLLYRVATAIRAMGHGGAEFHPDNALVVGGGLKGSTLPENYHEVILETLHIDPRHVYHMYAMQEVNTHMPRCTGGRYHVAPWLLLLPLDRDGETLLEPSRGEMECRAGFFDLSMDGRWGGVISGDRLHVDYGTCRCGRPGPTINADIVRYKDLPGGDYISCAGTIEAYVRGVA